MLEAWGGPDGQGLSPGGNGLDGAAPTDSQVCLGNQLSDSTTCFE